MVTNICVVTDPCASPTMYAITFSPIVLLLAISIFVFRRQLHRVSSGAGSTVLAIVKITLGALIGNAVGYLSMLIWLKIGQEFCSPNLYAGDSGLALLAPIVLLVVLSVILMVIFVAAILTAAHNRRINP